MTQTDIIHALQMHVPNLPHKDQIRRLSLFGSFLHHEDTVQSDVDILIELKHPLGYFGLSQISRSLEGVVNRPVDLVTPEALSKYFKKQVLTEAKTIYES